MIAVAKPNHFKRNYFQTSDDGFSWVLTPRFDGSLQYVNGALGRRMIDFPFYPN